ncbi:hypothetical protein [Flavobacterium sp. NKUCC04_CG]|uniref:hypothetical protein n=1 Tax=Flavobacterium sp. NKUCC04_CG TaxID=2842121 RepID=UPI001C5BD575|nr:hypothetical protein [Flavobacterium sp. NKUCC04_CG]MBW3517785.1 hypothetical protein [Flavobacterium sp. NKUCC04_CG]
MNLLLATWAGRSIGRLEKGGYRITVIDKFQEKRFGGRNDFVQLGDDGIYAFSPCTNLVFADNDKKRYISQGMLFHI